MGSSSRTTSLTDNRSISDQSVIDLQGADGSQAYSLSNVMDSDINLTMTDQGAVNSAFEALDGAMTTIRQQSSEAIQAATSATSDAVAAVVDGTKGDTQAVLGDFAKWGTLAVLGLAFTWAVVRSRG